MEKQYVLSDKEYIKLCNELERVNYQVMDLHRHLSNEDKERLRPQIKATQEKLQGVLKDLGWA